MKWIGRRESSNVDDRRGMSGGKVAAGGGIIGLVIYVVYTFMSGGQVDPSQIQRQIGGGDAPAQMTAEE